MTRYSDNGMICQLKAVLWRAMCQRRGQAVPISDLIQAVYPAAEPRDPAQCISQMMN